MHFKIEFKCYKTMLMTIFFTPSQCKFRQCASHSNLDKWKDNCNPLLCVNRSKKAKCLC